MSGINCIRLNEIHPSPREVDLNGDGLANDNDEFIEIYNSCDEDISLMGYTLDDIEGGGSNPYVIPYELIVEAKGYYLFWKQETKIILNNTNEDVVLRTATGELVDKFSYKSSVYDYSYQYNDEWSEWILGEPTPAYENMVLERFEIEDAPIGEVVELVARVVDIDNTYSGFYIIQDDTASVRIKLADGDLIKDKTYLFLGSLRQLSRYDELTLIAYKGYDLEFTDLNLTVQEIDDTYLDRRICVDGAISDIQKSYFAVTDISGDNIRIYLESTDEVLPHKVVTACGILQYKYSRYQLTSTLTDIVYKQVSSTGLAQTGTTFLSIITGWILIIFCVILWRYKFISTILWLQAKVKQIKIKQKSVLKKIRPKR